MNDDHHVVLVFQYNVNDDSHCRLYRWLIVALTQPRYLRALENRIDARPRVWVILKGDESLSDLCVWMQRREGSIEKGREMATEQQNGKEEIKR